MKKKLILGRIAIVVVVLAVFGYSMFPLQKKDFYKTFKKVTKDKPIIEKVVKKAKEIEKKSKSKYSSQAIEEAAQKLNVKLADYVDQPKIVNNHDVLRLVRSRSASSIKLGLDLAGGTEFNVSVTPDEDSNVSISKLRNRVIEILRNRINQSGLVEPEIATQGSSRISLKIPVSTKAQKDRYKKLIQMSAKLEFRLIAKNNAELVSKYRSNPDDFVPPVGYEKKQLVSTNKQGQKTKKLCFVKVHPEMVGTNIKDARVVLNKYNQRQIMLEFNSTGAEKFGEVTSDNVERRLGIVLDGTLYSAPVIRQAIYGGQASIQGDFSKKEADNIATALACGNLPAKIQIDSIFDTAPTLGKASVKHGELAGIFGLICVAIFMLIYYLRAGLVANLALIANVIIIVGAMASLGATLTLPGIAGIILTIGMAIDANVLIYERIREELDKNKTLANAVEIGYDRAFTTILDANLTTLLISLILYWQGSGPVKGFGITLSIGIVSTLFTSIFITRLIFDIWLQKFGLKKLRMMKILTKTKVPFLNLWKVSIVFSSILILSSFIICGTQFGDILSVDFTGGSQITLNYDNYISQGKIKNVLADEGYKAKTSYKSSPTGKDKLEIVLSDVSGETSQTAKMSEIENLLNKKFPSANFKGLQETTIGGLVGSQFTKSAIIALILSFIGMIIYVSLRFEMGYAVAAIIALLHDVIISTGVLIALDRQISLTVIAALLTVVGYSVNDTIIVFDRIRENISLKKEMKYRDIINLSINQTLSRTIITSFLTFIVVLILFLYGGVAINNFALVLLVGIIIGTYSSIFVASPLVAYWHRKAKGIKE